MTPKTEFPTSVAQIDRIHKAQHVYFKSKETLSISYRRKKLKALKSVLLKYEQDICEALYADFKKPFFESELTEFIIVMMELNRVLKNLNKWTKPEKVYSGILNFPSRSEIRFEPYGTILIIAPWNYPFQLIMSPLIATIAAGNTATLKPSELTPNTSQLIQKIISEVFNSDYIAVVEGGIEQSQKLLSLKWDYIFFTGSPKVGKIVYEAAAKNLTPVTLELGGKNACIVDDSVPLQLAARRIIWGKFVNAGQTCIAPDYLIVKNSIKDAFVNYLKKELKKAYGDNPQNSSDYPRIINKANFKRLTKLIEGHKIILGGEDEENELYLAPTLLDLAHLNSKTEREKLPEVMNEEIFGPILPLVTFNKEEEIGEWISKFDKPLALYVFAKNKSLINTILTEYSFGGGAVNDVIVQFTNHRLPFGGVGKSGIGAYHGHTSFKTFSHKKSVVSRATWLDLPMRYAPYTQKLKWIKKLSRWL